MGSIDRGWLVQRVLPQSDGHSIGSATNGVRGKRYRYNGVRGKGRRYNGVRGVGIPLANGTSGRSPVTNGAQRDKSIVTNGGHR